MKSTKKITSLRPPKSPQGDASPRLGTPDIESNFHVIFSATPNQKSEIELEFDRYFSMPRPDFASADVCKWWKKYEKELPNLATVGRRYLSIVMSSAASERLFSIAGQTVNDLRTQLDPDNVEKIVFL